ncbi:hypothetical protein Tco_0843345 [Tanacetum coccineum]|uniref:Uncharacterized protein n=1 Tax=Tanacetum coccineum TaxID=301880 RepID=A0ABQ5B5S8_9ASTR
MTQFPITLALVPSVTPPKSPKSGRSGKVGATGGDAQIDPKAPQVALVGQEDVHAIHAPHQAPHMPQATVTIHWTIAQRYSTWMVDRMIELMESRGMRYERFDGRIAPDTYLHLSDVELDRGPMVPVLQLSRPRPIMMYDHLDSFNTAYDGCDFLNGNTENHLNVNEESGGMHIIWNLMCVSHADIQTFFARQHT